MANLSDLLPQGGGQNNTDFVADGNITSGKPVIFTAAGKAAQVATSTASGSLPLGTQLTIESSASSIGRIKVTADPHNTNRWMVSYYNDSGTSGLRFKFVIRAGTSLSVGNEINSGSVSGINNAYAHSIAFDPSTADKFLMVFMPGSSAPTGYGTAAVVGTISGSAGSESISWGTPNRFETVNFDVANGIPDRVFALGTSGNYLTAWTNDPSGVKMRVLTVSGTTVTAPGSTTIPYSTAARGAEFGFKVNPYDATKALVFQNNADKHLYITDVAISGSTITATSSGNVVDNSNTYERQGCIDLCYLTSTKFVMIANRESATGGQGRTQIGNLSSGSFSYGSQIVYSGTSYPDDYVRQAQVVNSTVTPDKWILVWNDTTDKQTNGRIGSYSGDAITLGTNTEMDSQAYQYFDVAKADDADGHFLVMGDNNSNTAWVKLGKTGGTSSNLTSTNLLGIAAGAISDTATGTINTWGSRNEAQSSLTVASDYYVQTDGTITTDTSGQLIGKAITATQINMKDYTG
tara:strand:- start:350 stop:1909 length:1560 start_codon:yes stop_codon:yes gene_type:complete